MIFHGEKGSLQIEGAGYAIHDLAGKEIARGEGEAGDASHLQNFIAAIRGDAKLNAEIEEGFKSALLCHLGNIAWRTGSEVHFDPKGQQILGNPAAAALWTCEYRKRWEPAAS